MKRKNLIKFRVDLGLKSKDMAEKLGVSKVHYSDIENGKSNPSFGFITKFEMLCQEMNKEIEDIWELFKVYE